MKFSMKRKYAILLLIVIVSILSALLIPFPINPSRMPENVLLDYFESGTIWGTRYIIIYDNGTALYNSQKIIVPEEKMQNLKAYVNNKEYLVERTNLLKLIFSSFQSGCIDCGVSSISINVNGNAVPIEGNNVVNDIVNSIQLESRK